jgi:hypothetical protein
VNEREAARELLRELLNGALSNGNGNGHRAPDGAPPQVPAPPVAAVLRPSTWSGPPSRGEVIGPGASRPPARGDGDGAVEWVALDSDADLDRFVRALADRLEDPHERAAIRAGRVRFALRRAGGGAGAPAAGIVRVERGAVTERTVEKAAKAGARLVLAPGAVLTPLAREKARALGIEIEREPRC